MSKLKSLLLTVAVLLLMPLSVFADGKEKINVYLFKGDGCGYCAKALTFFNGLDEEYQSYFNLVEKEVWYDEDNAALMEEVAAYFGESVSGVPYIVIGEKSFQGYTAEFDEDIKAAIKTSYEDTDDSYVDVVASVSNGNVSGNNNDNTAITIIVILAIVAGVGFLIYMAREDVPEEVEVPVKEEVKETKKADTKKAPAKKTTTNKKTTTKKKATTKKKSNK